MVYQALYRVWRPQSFQDVVGQEHITKTLQNALLHEKITHAYLFSGPRGTGKTSAAKIIAKAINCERAPVSEPCNQCDACKTITNGSNPDVFEIDAASNNGVDEIRDIRDKVKFAPSTVKYKVYIIDEVHMLSIGAFNALLKTLEEPPQHVVFILATTEPHKIPLTIISRCQRFDFKRISAGSIVNRMNTIVQEQEVAIDEDALLAVARAADGGMRDALSLLDQAIALSEEQVTLDNVLMITGAVSQQFLMTLVQAIQSQQVPVALQALDELMNQGKDPKRFIEDIIYFYRDILLYQSSPQLEDILVRVKVDESFKQLADEIRVERIYEIIDILNKCQQEMKWTNHPKILLEIAIVQLCQQESKALPEVEHLVQRVKDLEKEVAHLKDKGITVNANSQEVTAQKDQRVQKVNKSSYRVPVGRATEVLKQATRQDLNQIKSNWGNMLEQLKKQNKVSHAALLSESEPVAASDKAFILSFKFEIHCKMAAENTNNVRDNLEGILLDIIGKRYEMIAVPEPEWGKIREEYIREQRNDTEDDKQKEDDPLITEAQKLFGTELIEIIED
ncbi:DNA polymerase-3 subunit gamma/tau [Bacillus mesophilus]|uniref:DNA-directed DNA polymerase n=1 Tax=Bacillus mesophilus TaxID=1808955 RepID=A0A6M0QCY9_9BACI|nr:DNA polymerase III subunit gamma/tau [Bacillus mesophilus]MBM7663502.1 DNA polymerase-3 subunit gamma/tau [Bacillus mesophilus]NEY74221.1 DNA polymerase III subunit gamma/tau [Bacillus mesophilus]